MFTIVQALILISVILGSTVVMAFTKDSSKAFKWAEIIALVGVIVSIGILI